VCVCTREQRDGRHTREIERSVHPQGAHTPTHPHTNTPTHPHTHSHYTHATDKGSVIHFLADQPPPSFEHFFGTRVRLNVFSFALFVEDRERESRANHSTTVPQAQCAHPRTAHTHHLSHCTAPGIALHHYSISRFLGWHSHRCVFCRVQPRWYVVLACFEVQLDFCGWWAAACVCPRAGISRALWCVSSRFLCLPVLVRLLRCFLASEVCGAVFSSSSRETPR
jgi:hypothetical protein